MMVRSAIRTGHGQARTIIIIGRIKRAFVKGGFDVKTSSSGISVSGSAPVPSMSSDLGELERQAEEAAAKASAEESRRDQDHIA